MNSPKVRWLTIFANGLLDRLAETESPRVISDWRAALAAQSAGCVCADKRSEIVCRVGGYHDRIGCLTCDAWDNPPIILAKRAESPEP